MQFDWWQAASSTTNQFHTFPEIRTGRSRHCAFCAVVKPQPSWVICGGYWTSHGGWCGFYIGEPDRQIAKKKRDKDAQQKDSDGTAEKSGGGEHDTGVLGKFPSSEPFDFDKYDIKEVLREAGLM